MRIVVSAIVVFLMGCEKMSLNGEQAICPEANVHAYQYAPRDSLYIYVSVSTYTPGELFIGDNNGMLFPPGIKMQDGQRFDFSLRLGSTLWYRYRRCGLERDEVIQQINF